MVADRLEDDPWVAAPDVQDVGADGQGVEQGDRLLHEVRQRQERNEPVLLGRDRVVGGLDRRDDVRVAEHHALGGARGAAREDDLEQVGGGRSWPGSDLLGPVGRPVGVRFGGEVLDGRGREVLEAGLARVRGVATGADREARGLRLLGDPLDRIGRHPQVERDDHDADPHRPEVDGRQCGRRRRPGQHPLALRQTRDARRRQATARLRRSSSRKLHDSLEPSSRRSDSAGRSPNVATAPSSTSSRVSIGRSVAPRRRAVSAECGLVSCGAVDRARDGEGARLARVSTSYTAVGPPDAPAIVLVHGTRLSRGMWHPQLLALSGGFRVIALDLPGHGALRDRDFDWDGAVDEIARVIDEAAGGRAVLCGLSLGGYLAIDVAARYPDKVAGLAICGASAQPRGRLMPIGIRWLALLMDRTASPAGAGEPVVVPAALSGRHGERDPGRRVRVPGGLGSPPCAHRPGPAGHVRGLSGSDLDPQRPARRAVPARSGRVRAGRARPPCRGPGPGHAPRESRSSVGLQRGPGQVQRGRRPDPSPGRSGRLTASRPSSTLRQPVGERPSAPSSRPSAPTGRRAADEPSRPGRRR